MPSVPAGDCHQRMFRLTQTEEEGATVFVIEGKLSGPTLTPLGEFLRTLHAEVGGNRPVIVDLMGVTSIDGDGKQLLTDLHARGASFRAKGCLNRAIVEGITCCAPATAGAVARPDQQADGRERGGDK
jgi:ABC-type transporter Mla MlaB component